MGVEYLCAKRTAQATTGRRSKIYGIFIAVTKGPKREKQQEKDAYYS